MAEAKQLQKLEQLIEKADLSKDEKNAFFNVLLVAEAKDLDQIITLFEEDYSWIEWLYNNYREKKDAFDSGDQQKLERIYEDERSMLEKDDQFKN